MRTAFLLSAFVFVASALSTPTLVPIIKHDGPINPGSYIVKFKDSAADSNTLAALEEKLRVNGQSSITYNYAPLFNGVAIRATPSALDAIQMLPSIQYIEYDSIVSTLDHIGSNSASLVPVLAKSRHALVARTDSMPKGGGVTIYGIDTGIYVEHSCFGGRAKWGAVFGGYSQQDGNGHGTHTAATAAGNGFGPATASEVIAIKVLSDTGSGSTSDVIMGVRFAYSRHKEKGGPSVVNMSLGGPGFPFSIPAFNISALNDAVKEAIKTGMHFTIAAGNSNTVADYTSPANVKEAITVGALNTTQGKTERASFSNYGKFLDVWAPGVDINSAWISGPNSAKKLSGTSMAAPAVAGLAAVMISACRQLDNPARFAQELKANAENNVTFSAADSATGLISNHLFAQLWNC